MRSLIASVLLIASSFAQAETLVDKMYELHFQSVKETLAIAYGMNADEIKKESLFSNANSNGKAIRPDIYLQAIVKVGHQYQNKSYHLESFVREFIKQEQREGCNPQNMNEQGVFIVDAECISRALWFANQREA